MGMTIFFVGSFSISYLEMPGSFYQSGIVLAIISLLYSMAINIFSTRIIIKECIKHSIGDYYEYYKHILGDKYGTAAFLLFSANIFLLSVCILLGLNETLTDFLKSFFDLGLFTDSSACFWPVVMTVVMFPFVYRYNELGLKFITVITFVSILVSIITLVVTSFQNHGFTQGKRVKAFDFSGSVFSYDTSYFIFIIQLNIFDVLVIFKSKKQSHFELIEKTCYYSSFIILVATSVIGTVE